MTHPPQSPPPMQPPPGPRPGWQQPMPPPPPQAATSQAPAKRNPLTSKPAIGIMAGLVGLILGASMGGGQKPVTATPGSGSTVTVTAVSTVQGAPGATVTATATVKETIATTVTAAPPGPATAFKDGTYLVNKDIQPGTYRTDNASGGCYWARLSAAGGGLDSIIANENAKGPTVVTIKATDVAFQSSRCGSWSKV